MSPRSTKRPAGKPGPRSQSRAGRTAIGPGARQPAAGHDRPERRVPSKIKSQAAAAGLAAAVAPAVIRAVLDTGKRMESALGEALKAHGEISWTNRRLVARALAALLRWWGWIEPLRLVRVEDQLALAWLLDFPEIDEICRIWARKTGRSPDRMLSAGDAPNWTARATCLKRWMEGKPVTADPWLLVPGWLREQLPLPPGDVPAKARRLAFLHSLQTHWPLWVGVRGGSEKTIWNELREAGLKPWIQRRLTSAAKLPPDTDLRSIRAYQASEIAIDDLSSQALGPVCDPDPGERWWCAIGGSGLHALHLGMIMNGKGSVIATFDNDKQRHGVALRLRRFPWRNVSARLWDGRHAPGKPGSFDGVLVDAPCSDVGIWRRHPEARWTVTKDDLPRLAAAQTQLLELAGRAVRPGGTLVYSVATATVIETADVVNAFLKTHPEFRLDPFPHPMEETTTTGTLQLWPHLHDSEARFLARMMRTNTEGKHS
jgi:16S rRNA (cytosine967-C5)-methyltransferase